MQHLAPALIEAPLEVALVATFLIDHAIVEQRKIPCKTWDGPSLVEQRQQVR